MTLYRQLLVIIGALVVVLFTGTLFVKLQTTRSFLVNQLESHGQDTATSLGLSIASYLGSGDIATVDTMMNAIFDRGYYRAITLVDLSDKVVLEKKMEIHIETVPAWFVDNISLEVPSSRALVSSGWRQLGYLYVSSHPGFAYQSLWSVVVKMSKIFSIAAIAVSLVIIPVLHILFKPLRQVEEQASALCRKQYTIQEKLPKTRELRSVVTAMNSMVGKVKSMFEEQSLIVQRLGKSVYTDSLTGLANRRYFENQVKSAFVKEHSQKNGVLLLAEIDDLIALNREEGYEGGDQFIIKIGVVVDAISSNYANATAARISGGAFVLFIPGVSVSEASSVAAQMAEKFVDISDNGLETPQTLGHVGGVFFEEEATVAKLLSEADRVLQASKLEGDTYWKIETMRGKNSSSMDEQMWRRMFMEVTEKETVSLAGQKIFPCHNNSAPLHMEIFAKIENSATGTLGANVFVPKAEKFGYMSQLDRIIVAKTLELEKVREEKTALTINLSASSLRDKKFMEWLYTILAKRDREAPQIIFELREKSVIRNIDLLSNIRQKLSTLGGGIGVDSFGQNFQNFGYIKTLQPAYVKIDRSFTIEIEKGNEDSLFFIQALTGAAHSLDILVIAQGVESEAQLNTLCGLNVDAVQGYLLDTPVELEEGRLC